MANALITILFMASSICALILAKVFFEKGTFRSHFLHIFSISYLATLALREVNEIVAGNFKIWLIIICVLATILFYISFDIKKGGKKFAKFSHHHFKEFSFALASIFILHSFIDGLLFNGSEIIRGGLILHRFIDGFVILGLITDGGEFSFKKLSQDRFWILTLFLIAPAIGFILPSVILSSSWIILKDLFMFVLLGLSMFDLVLEINHNHLSKKDFILAVILAVLLGISIGH